MFVGTLVRDYAGIGLTITGSSPCKWYINLDIPDVLELKESEHVLLSMLLSRAYMMKTAGGTIHVTDAAELQSHMVLPIDALAVVI